MSSASIRAPPRTSDSQASAAATKALQASGSARSAKAVTAAISAAGPARRRASWTIRESASQVSACSANGAFAGGGEVTMAGPPLTRVRVAASAASPAPNSSRLCTEAPRVSLPANRLGGEVENAGDEAGQVIVGHAVFPGPDLQGVSQERRRGFRKGGRGFSDRFVEGHGVAPVLRSVGPDLGWAFEKADPTGGWPGPSRFTRPAARLGLEAVWRAAVDKLNNVG